MELPRLNGRGGGVFGGIKDKLGFGGGDADYDEEYYDESYDDYADDSSDDAGYSSFAPVTTRNAGTRPRSRRSYTDIAADDLDERRGSHAPLVSFDDVRANTQVPDSLRRDPLAGTQRTRATSSLSRDSVGHASDYLYSEPDADSYDNAYAEEEDEGRGHRPSGLSSLFGGDGDDRSEETTRTQRRPSGYDPYNAYVGGGSVNHNPSRSVTVISPREYGDVEQIARSLKAGDAVVLSLRTTPGELSKRVLDFAFGVASALDAAVNCEADKVFVVSRGALSESERSQLRSQGVL